jgi:hypothetical protein
MTDGLAFCQKGKVKSEHTKLIVLDNAAAVLFRLHERFLGVNQQ